MAKFNLNKFSKELKKEVYASLRKDAFKKLPDDLRERFNNAGGNININSETGNTKVSMSNHDESLLNEVLFALDKN